MGNIIYPMWAECPALTRLLCVGFPVLGILFLLAERSSETLAWFVGCLFQANIVSLKHLKVWTLALTPFYSPISDGMSFLMTLFTIYMAMMYLPEREKAIGSTPTLVWMCTTSVIINLLYLFIMFIFEQATGQVQYEYASSKGLWPLIMVIISLRVLSDPSGQTNFWGFVNIPNKWYPLALAGFFCLINGLKILWDFMAAIAVGYAYFPLNLERLVISQARADWLEQSVCKCLGGGRCSFMGASWVGATGSTAYANNESSIYATMSDFGRSAQQMASRVVQPGAGGGSETGTELFRGSGNRLGEGDAEAPAPANAS